MRLGMARYILKLVTISLKRGIDMAFSYNAREPRNRQYAASNHSGVVGNTGKNKPHAPSINTTTPMIVHTIFILAILLGNRWSIEILSTTLRL